MNNEFATLWQLQVPHISIFKNLARGMAPTKTVASGNNDANRFQTFSVTHQRPLMSVECLTTNIAALIFAKVKPSYHRLKMRGCFLDSGDRVSDPYRDLAYKHISLSRGLKAFSLDCLRD